MDAEYSTSIGQIVLATQERLERLRNQLRLNDMSLADFQKSEEILEEAERDLEYRAQEVLNVIIQQVPVAPEMYPTSLVQTKSGPVESRRPSRGTLKNTSIKKGKSLEDDQRLMRVAVKEQMKLGRELQKIANPHDPTNRAFLEQRFGIADTTVKPKGIRGGHGRKVPGKLALGKPSDLLPISDRDLTKGVQKLIDVGIVDKNADISSMFETRDNPLQTGSVKLHVEHPRGPSIFACDYGEQRSKYNIGSNLKLDLMTEVGRTLPYSYTLGPALRKELKIPDGEGGPKIHPITPATSVVNLTRIQPAEPKAQAGRKTSPRLHVDVKFPKSGAEKENLLFTPSPVSLVASESAVVDKSNAREYNTLLDSYSLHHFMIRKGKVIRDAPEFESFERSYWHLAGNINSICARIENFMHLYSVPVAIIDGKRLAQLAEVYGDGKMVDKENILSCIVNKEEVARYIVPSRQYRDFEGVVYNDGKVLAAIAIQALWRGKLIRKMYSLTLREIRCATRVQKIWRGFVAMKKYRDLVKENRKEYSKMVHESQLAFCEEYESRFEKSNRRVVIHIPSYFNTKLRRQVGESELGTNPYERSLQCLDISRLCLLSDPNLSIIYVAAAKPQDSQIKYILSLLESSIEGFSEYEAKQRFIVMVPEELERLKKICGNISLATALWCSPKTMRKIKSIFGIRATFIFASEGVVAPEVFKVAHCVDVPVLSPFTQVAFSYSSYSGSVRLFNLAGVAHAPGLLDVKSASSIDGKVLGLHSEAPSIPQWVVRMDDVKYGLGQAFVDVAKIAENDFESGVIDDKCWSFSDHDIESWEDFKRLFDESGLGSGVIQAYPNSSVPVACVSVTCFISPSGEVSVLCAHDVLKSGNVYVGCLFPMALLPWVSVYSPAAKVCSVARDRGIFGYLTVEFEAYYNEDDAALGQSRSRQGNGDDSLIVRAVSVTPGYVHQVATYEFFRRLAGVGFVLPDRPPVGYKGNNNTPAQEGESVEEESEFDRPQYQSCEYVTIHQPNVNSRSFYYVACTQLRHEYLHLVNQARFFEACRENGIVFDAVDRSGIIFNVFNDFLNGTFWSLSLGTSRLGVLSKLGSLLRLLKKEISQACERAGVIAVPNQPSSNVGEVKQRKILKAICRATNVDGILSALEEAARLYDVS